MASINPSSPTINRQSFFTNDKDFVDVMRKNIQECTGLCEALLCHSFDPINTDGLNSNKIFQVVMERLIDLNKYYSIFTEDPIIGNINAGKKEFGKNDNLTPVEAFLEPLFYECIQLLLMNSTFKLTPEYMSWYLLKFLISDCDEWSFKVLSLDLSINLRSKLVRMVCEHGVNVNLNGVDGNEKALLIWPAEKGYFDIVQTLVQFGADVNARDHYGDTALIHAARNQQSKIIEYLLEHNANVSIRNNFGSTVLNYAAHSCPLNILQRLVDHPTNINPLDIAILGEAITSGDSNKIQYLKEQKHLDGKDLIFSLFHE